MQQKDYKTVKKTLLCAIYCFRVVVLISTHYTNTLQRFLGIPGNSKIMKTLLVYFQCTTLLKTLFQGEF